MAVAVFGLSIVRIALVAPTPEASLLHPTKTSLVKLRVDTMVLLTETDVVVPTSYHPSPVVEPTGEMTVK